MDRINLIAGALVEICCCCLKQNFSDVAEDGEGIALFFFPPSENLILIPQMTRCGGPFGGLFPHKTITNLKCHRNTMQRNNPLKIWDITENYFTTPPPPKGWGWRAFHWPVIFIVAVQNETTGSSRLK